MTLPRRLGRALASRGLLWVLLAAPGAGVLAAWAAGALSFGEAVGRTGTAAAVLLVPATATTPLRALWPRSRALAWLAARRLDLGGACLGYAAAHAAVDALGKHDPLLVLREARLGWLLAGWAALLILAGHATLRLVLARRAPGEAWPRLHRVTYAAAALVVLHWALVAFDPLTERVQGALWAGGYYAGPIDGVIGPLSRDALGRFQRDHGLPVTRRITPEVLEILGIVPN